jgi:hypothetical protein
MMAAMRGRVLAWAGGVVVLAVAAGLGTYFVVAGLGQASQVSSVAVMFVGLAGLVVAAWGIGLAHRDAQNLPAGAERGQRVDRSTIVGGVTQVRGVRGSVRLGGSSARLPARAAGADDSPAVVPGPASLAAAAPPGETPAGSGQSVTGSQVGGEVRQVDDVGGDLDVDR